jgi:hypothetical protein|tara:strand:- start:3751 stop:3873 length:123 start_codon:yes stop_codon:yes gene_type:complete
MNVPCREKSSSGYPKSGGQVKFLSSKKLISGQKNVIERRD